MQIFLSIVVPLCTLAFAAGSIGGEREDRTLLFILVRPLPRWAVLASQGGRHVAAGAGRHLRKLVHLLPNKWRGRPRGLG